MNDLMWKEITQLFTLANLVFNIGDPDKPRDPHLSHCKTIILRLVREHGIAMSRQLAHSTDSQLETSMDFDDQVGGVGDPSLFLLLLLRFCLS